MADSERVIFHSGLHPQAIAHQGGAVKYCMANSPQIMIKRSRESGWLVGRLAVEACKDLQPMAAAWVKHTSGHVFKGRHGWLVGILAVKACKDLQPNDSQRVMTGSWAHVGKTHARPQIKGGAWEREQRNGPHCSLWSPSS